MQSPCANLNVVNTLNMEFDKRKEEISKLEEELDKTRREHDYDVFNLKKVSQNRLNELQLKNTSLQAELEKAATNLLDVDAQPLPIDNSCILKCIQPCPFSYLAKSTAF